jgi:hypothetical protein
MLRATGLRALARTVAAGVALACLPAMAQVAPPQKGTGSEIGMSMDPSQGPFANRGGSLPPIIGNLQAEGIKFISIGDEGAKGYLGEAANGRFQAFYVTPDGQHVVAGLLFRTGGANVTSRQVARMMRRFTEAAKAVPEGAGLPEIAAVDDGTPDPGVPFADWMRGNGAKLTPFLDRDGGLDGYLAEAAEKDGRPGKMQAIYVMPGGHHAVAGVLIRRGGTLVTGLQIAALQQRYVADLEAKSREQASVIDPNSPRPPAAPPASDVRPVAPVSVVPGQPSEPAVVPEAAPVAESPGPAGVPRPEPGAVPRATPAPAGPVSTRPAADADEFLVTASDRKAFLEAARTTVWFPVGLRTAPVVWMLSDPQCPFCHETWKQLKTLVFAGKLQVRVIMIAGLAGSDPLARSILSRGEPTGADAGKAWLEGEGSIQGVAVKAAPADGVPSGEAARRFVAYNSEFARKYKITRTPFLFYEAGDDRLYASMGIPSDFDKFLAAVR